MFAIVAAVCCAKWRLHALRPCDLCFCFSCFCCPYRAIRMWNCSSLPPSASQTSSGMKRTVRDRPHEWKVEYRTGAGVRGLWGKNPQYEVNLLLYSAGNSDTISILSVHLFTHWSAAICCAYKGQCSTELAENTTYTMLKEALTKTAFPQQCEYNFRVRRVKKA